MIRKPTNFEIAMPAFASAAARIAFLLPSCMRLPRRGPGEDSGPRRAAPGYSMTPAPARISATMPSATR